VTVVVQRTARRTRGPKTAQNHKGGGSALTRLFARMRQTLLPGDAHDRRIALGAKGERLAVRRLRREGYRVVARNFRAGGAEIDAIAWDGDTLVFIEVKTRVSFGAGSPEESVHALKQRHIRRAAELYARAHAAEEPPMRFDVVAVSRLDGRWHVDIIKDAF
jgi:putative endonuclease